MAANLKEIKVRDIMSKRIVSCAPDLTAEAAAKEMKDKDVGSIIVLSGKNPLGIVTREDMTNKVVAYNKNPSKVKVKEIMSSPVITVGLDDKVEDVATRMTRYGFERMPVKDGNNIVGLISIRDVIRSSPGLIDILKEHLEKDSEQEPGAPEGGTEGECEICGNYQKVLSQINDQWVCDNCKEEAEDL